MKFVDDDDDDDDELYKYQSREQQDIKEASNVHN